MKRTNQIHTGNVTGEGKRYRGRPAPAIADIPRNQPDPRPMRRMRRLGY